MVFARFSWERAIKEVLVSVPGVFERLAKR
jgi:hypothetical protein